MTDKELIARLLYLSRVTRDYDQEDMTSADYADMPVATKEAADRIEALTKERDEADDLAKAAFADGASNNIRLAETSYRVKWLEAKLAKAVEALEKAEAYAEELEAARAERAKAVDRAIATLAEIKGERHE